MAYKVVKDVDKFNDKTTLTMSSEYKLSTNLGLVSHGAQLAIRYLSMPEIDSILIDYYYEATDDVHDYLYLDGGEMIIRINDRENISLPFLAENERDSYVHNNPNGPNKLVLTEYNFVEIDKATLEKICNAKSIEIKINGHDSKVYKASKCQGLIEYCKVFYNGVYYGDINTMQNASTVKNTSEAIKIIGAIVGGLALFGLIVSLF